MTTLTWIYTAYLAISGFVTVYVAHTLHKHGRLFLIDVFGGNVRAADAVNHLLLVGCYLVNIAYVLLTLKAGLQVDTVVAAVELLGRKVGLILGTLGVMHFFNLAVLSAVLNRGLRRVAGVDARTA